MRWGVYYWSCCFRCYRGSLPDIKLGTAGIGTTTSSSTAATVNGYQPGAPSSHVNSRAAHPGVSKYSSFVHHTTSSGRNKQTSAGGAGGAKCPIPRPILNLLVRRRKTEKKDVTAAAVAAASGSAAVASAASFDCDRRYVGCVL